MRPALCIFQWSGESEMLKPLDEHLYCAVLRRKRLSWLLRALPRMMFSSDRIAAAGSMIIAFFAKVI